LIKKFIFNKIVCHILKIAYFRKDSGYYNNNFMYVTHNTNFMTWFKNITLKKNIMDIYNYPHLFNKTILSNVKFFY